MLAGAVASTLAGAAVIVAGNAVVVGFRLVQRLML